MAADHLFGASSGLDSDISLFSASQRSHSHLRWKGLFVVPHQSMFEFASGEPAFMALAKAHHRRCLQDEVLSHAFARPLHPENVRQLAT